MKIIFVTMSSLIRPYWSLYKKLLEHGLVGRAAFYASNQSFFRSFSNKNPMEGVEILKEWEIIKKSKQTKLDWKRIHALEEKYFQDEPFWFALSCDRRIFMGKYTKVVQDYCPRYSYNEMIQIFQTGMTEIEAFFKKYNPDMIIGYTPTTFGEYFFYRIASAENIPYLMLRPTKIKNRVTITQDVEEKHPQIRADYELFLKKGCNKQWLEPARAYIREIHEKGKTVYEGAIRFSTFNLKSLLFKYPLQLLRHLWSDIKLARVEHDHYSDVSLTRWFFYDKPLREIRAKRFISRFAKRIKKIEEVDKHKYIFFPLHSEPEVAISIFSKYYPNQIEAIRSIAMQLPSQYKLIVKEHPRNLGRRTYKYIENILEIPNVDLMDPSVPALTVAQKTRMAIVLSSSVGFEALVCQKPVITLGNTMYNMLPKVMVNHVDNVKSLYKEIQWSLDNYQYDENHLLMYIASIYKNSIPLNLYSILLQKKGRLGGEGFSREKYEENIDRLFSFFWERTRNVRQEFEHV